MSYNNGLGSLQPGFSTTDVSATARTEQSKSTQTSAAGSTASSGVDQASLSSTGGLIAQALSSESDVRMDKVTALQSTIAAGTYNVPASSVADKLMSALLS
jgi:flagellar biosynthesis anti-sigma factor FlgM